MRPAGDGFPAWVSRLELVLTHRKTGHLGTSQALAGGAFLGSKSCFRCVKYVLIQFFRLVDWGGIEAPFVIKQPRKRLQR